MKMMLIMTSVNPRVFCLRKVNKNKHGLLLSLSPLLQSSGKLLQFHIGTRDLNDWYFIFILDSPVLILDSGESSSSWSFHSEEIGEGHDWTERWILGLKRKCLFDKQNKSIKKANEHNF